MDILGIFCFYHDSAACFVRDGKIIAAAQEERFTRKKHDPGFPRHTINYCLAEAGIAVNAYDAHPNEFAHALISPAIAEFIEKEAFK